MLEKIEEGDDDEEDEVFRATPKFYWLLNIRTIIAEFVRI